MRIFFTTIILVLITMSLNLFIPTYSLSEYTNYTSKKIIYPKDLTKFEHFDKKGLGTIQKTVDEGHQPWRSCPVYYAKFSMNFYYPDLDPNERERLPAKLILENIEDNEAIAEIVHDGKELVDYPHNSKWDKIPMELKLKSNRAIVKVIYDGKEHTVYLHKAFPSNPESIWVVEKIVIEGE